MINFLSIGRRLAVGFAVVLLFTLAIAAVSLWRVSLSTDETRQMMDVPLAKERMMADWYRLVYTGVRRTSAIAKSSDPSLATFFAQDTAESTKQAGELQKKIEPLLVEDREKEIYASMQDDRKRYVYARDTVMQLKRDGKADEADKLMADQYVGASHAYLVKLEQLLAEEREDIDALANAVADNGKTSFDLLVLMGGVAVLAGLLVGWAISRSITRPVAEAVSMAERVAAGDLTTKEGTHHAHRGSDEMGRLLVALEKMQGSLAGMIGGIRTAAQSIGNASSEIAIGNRDLSSRTEETASSLQSAASSMEQVTGTVKQSAGSAKQANQLARAAADVATRGGEVVSKVVTTMEAIDASSKRIADIIGTIDGIAFQTNILALNAAVEAARAGEQGRGFAVVASEVRSLAQRSAAAAKEIKTLIGSSVESVEDGTRLVAEAGNTMKEIVTSVGKVSDIIGEISATSSEQSQGIGEVNASMTGLDQMTQQNAALVEQSSAAAESLREQAARLSEVVSQFKIG